MPKGQDTPPAPPHTSTRRQLDPADSPNPERDEAKLAFDAKERDEAKQPLEVYESGTPKTRRASRTARGRKAHPKSRRKIIIYRASPNIALGHR